MSSLRKRKRSSGSLGAEDSSPIKNSGSDQPSPRKLRHPRAERSKHTVTDHTTAREDVKDTEELNLIKNSDSNQLSLRKTRYPRVERSRRPLTEQKEWRGDDEATQEPRNTRFLPRPSGWENFNDKMLEINDNEAREATPRPPPPAPPQFTRIDPMNGPVINDRQVAYKGGIQQLPKMRSVKRIYVSTIGYDPKQLRPYGGRIGSKTLFYLTVQTTLVPTIPIQNEFFEHFRCLLERWPFSLEASALNVLRRLALSLTANAIQQFNAINVAGTSGPRRKPNQKKLPKASPEEEQLVENGYKIHVTYLNTDVDDFDTVEMCVWANNVSPNHTVPGLPINAIYVQGNKYDSVRTIENTVPHDLRGEARMKHVAAFRAAANFYYRFSNLQISAGDLKELLKIQLAQWGVTSTIKKPGVYGGSALTNLWRNWRLRGIEVMPGKNVHKDFPKLPKFLVKTAHWQDARRIVVLMESTFLATKSLTQAWTNGYRFASAMNARLLDGERPWDANPCECDDPPSSEIQHSCDDCGLLFQCKDLLSTGLGTRVDAVCFTKIPFDNRALAVEDRYLKLALHERTKRGYSKALLRPNEKRTVARLRSLTSNLTFRREYAKGQPEGLHARLGIAAQYNPGTQSLDAAFPFDYAEIDESMLESDDCHIHIITDKNGNPAVPFCHSFDNTFSTEYSTNLFKHIWLPAWPAETGKFLRDTRPFEEKVASFVDTADKIHAASILTSYVVATRGRNVTPEMYQRTRKIWVRGSYKARDPRLEKITGSYHGGSQSNIDLSKWAIEIEVIRGIVAQMVDRYPRFDLQVARDGAPFPFHCPIPKWWNWQTLITLASERLVRLRDWCNRHFETIDNEITIILTICLTFLRPEIGDQCLGLPFVPWVRHPLRFTLAHKVHGHQLRSGWNIKDEESCPETLDDWQDDLNNMSVEASSTNFAKWNFSSAVYPQIRTYLEDVQMPLELYNPESSDTSVDEDVPEEFRDLPSEITLEAIRNAEIDLALGGDDNDVYEDEEFDESDPIESDDGGESVDDQMSEYSPEDDQVPDVEMVDFEKSQDTPAQESVLLTLDQYYESVEASYQLKLKAIAEQERLHEDRVAKLRNQLSAKDQAVLLKSAKQNGDGLQRASVNAGHGDISKKIDRLMEITKLSADQARSYLMAAGWNLSDALDRFYADQPSEPQVHIPFRTTTTTSANDIQSIFLPCLRITMRPSRLSRLSALPVTSRCFKKRSD